MKKLFCLALVTVSLTAISAFADQPDEHSSEGQLSRRDSKAKKRAEGSVFLAQMVLAELGFWVGPFDAILDEKTKSALCTYEKKRKIPETGDSLSFETLQQLQADAQIIDYYPIDLPNLHVFTDFWDSGYVSATGTWVLLNEKMADPEQTSKINCDKGANTCTEAVATVSGEGSDRNLFVAIETY